MIRLTAAVLFCAVLCGCEEPRSTPKSYLVHSHDSAGKCTQVYLGDEYLGALRASCRHCLRTKEPVTVVVDGRVRKVVVMDSGYVVQLYTTHRGGLEVLKEEIRESVPPPMPRKEITVGKKCVDGFWRDVIYLTDGKDVVTETNCDKADE